MTVHEQMVEADRHHAKCLKDDVENGVFPFGELMLNERLLLARALSAFAGMTVTEK